jgi:hypothetical protein
MKNKYIYRSRVSERVSRKIFKRFSLVLTATQTVELTGLNLNTTELRFNNRGKNLYYILLKEFWNNPLNYGSLMKNYEPCSWCLVNV